MSQPFKEKPSADVKMNVILLLLDCLSNRTFERQLPALASLLRSQRANLPSTNVVRFTRHSVVGGSSVPNQIRIFCNDDCKNDTKNVFAAFKKKGFITSYYENYCPRTMSMADFLNNKRHLDK